MLKYWTIIFYLFLYGFKQDLGLIKMFNVKRSISVKRKALKESTISWGNRCGLLREVMESKVYLDLDVNLSKSQSDYFKIITNS